MVNFPCIVFEGLNGSGKTTLLKMVADWLRKEGKYYVHETFEPFGVDYNYNEVVKNIASPENKIMYSVYEDLGVHVGSLRASLSYERKCEALRAYEVLERDIFTRADKSIHPLHHAVLSNLAMEARIYISSIASNVYFLNNVAKRFADPTVKDNLQFIALMDRFYFSTFAYQGGGKGLGSTFIANEINSTCIIEGIQPLTFFIMASRDTRIKRIKEREEIKDIEDKCEDCHTEAFESRAGKAYRKLTSGNPNCFRINNCGNINSAFEQIKRIIKRELPRIITSLNVVMPLKYDWR